MLKKQHERSREDFAQGIAAIQATLYNAHFRGPGDAIWTPDDVLGRGDREQRQAAIDAQRRKDAQDLLAAQAHNSVESMRLLTLRKQQRTVEETEDIPVWARR